MEHFCIYLQTCRATLRSRLRTSIPSHHARYPNSGRSLAKTCPSEPLNEKPNLNFRQNCSSPSTFNQAARFRPSSNSTAAVRNETPSKSPARFAKQPSWLSRAHPNLCLDASASPSWRRSQASSTRLPVVSRLVPRCRLPAK